MTSPAPTNSAATITATTTMVAVFEPSALCAASSVTAGEPVVALVAAPAAELRIELDGADDTADSVRSMFGAGELDSVGVAAGTGAAPGARKITGAGKSGSLAPSADSCAQLTTDPSL